MALSVEEAKRFTRDDLLSQGAQEQDIDLSYITDDLLKGYENAPSKKDEGDRDAFDGSTIVPAYFFGNNRVSMGNGNHAYTNSNASDGYDSPGHKCGSGYRWQVFLSSYRDNPCPGNNPSGGFEGWPRGTGP